MLATNLSFQGVNRYFILPIVFQPCSQRLSQHSYSPQLNHLHSWVFSVEPRRTPLSQSVSAFDVTISSIVGVAASLCSHSLALITTEAFTCRYNPVSLPELCFAPSAYVFRLPVVAGSVPRRQLTTFLFVSALAVRCRFFGHLIPTN